MRTWKLARQYGERCGGCWGLVPEGKPIQIVELPGVKEKRLRCVECAGESPDPATVDALLHEKEAKESAETVTANTAFKGGAPVLDGFSQVSDAASQGLNHLLKHTGEIQGVRRSRQPAPPPPKPFHEIADDPAVVRAGEPS